jgi:polar amino acid transport system substrate-binding protein
MDKVFRRLVALLVTIAMTLALIACGNGNSGGGSGGSGEDTVAAIKNTGKIKIGIYVDRGPFGFVDDRDDYQGYDVYFAQRITLDMLGDQYLVEWVPVDDTNRAEKLNSGAVDLVLAHYAVTPDTQKEVDFSSPYMKVSTSVVTASDSTIATVEDLEGKKVIVTTGSLADTYVTNNAKAAEVIRHATDREAYTALADGAGDALCSDNAVAYAWITNRPNFKIAVPSVGDETTIAVAVKKGNSTLLNWVNKEMEALVADEFFLFDFKLNLAPIMGDDVEAALFVIEGATPAE